MKISCSDRERGEQKVLFLVSKSAVCLNINLAVIILCLYEQERRQWERMTGNGKATLWSSQFSHRCGDPRCCFSQKSIRHCRESMTRATHQHLVRVACLRDQRALVGRKLWRSLPMTSAEGNGEVHYGHQMNPYLCPIRAN